jgi:transcriptional regulator with XRE-family HTH domain
MGRASRERPQKLAEKLLRIRQHLGFSQNEMLTALDLKEKVFRSAVSGYELGTREPSLIVILKYARLAGVSVESIIDDEMNLPKDF